VFTRDLCLLLTKCTQAHTFYFVSILTASSRLCLGLPSVYFPLSFPTETAYISLSHACVQFRNRRIFNSKWTRKSNDTTRQHSNHL